MVNIFHEIKPVAEIMIDKASRMKWGDFVHQRFPTWDFYISRAGKDPRNYIEVQKMLEESS